MACVTYSDQGPHFHVSRQRGAGAWGWEGRPHVGAGQSDLHLADAEDISLRLSFCVRQVGDSERGRLGDN